MLSKFQIHYILAQYSGNSLELMYDIFRICSYLNYYFVSFGFQLSLQPILQYTNLLLRKLTDSVISQNLQIQIHDSGFPGYTSSFKLSSRFVLLLLQCRIFIICTLAILLLILQICAVSTIFFMESFLSIRMKALRIEGVLLKQTPL